MQLLLNVAFDNNCYMLVRQLNFYLLRVANNYVQYITSNIIYLYYVPKHLILIIVFT